MDDEEKVAKLDHQNRNINRWALVVVPAGGRRYWSSTITIVGNLTYSITLKHALELGKILGVVQTIVAFPSIYMAVKLRGKNTIHLIYN
jgi:hypothetical protein